MMKILIPLLFFVSISHAKYDRRDWKHWIDSDHDCQNTRTEILIERSKVSVKFKNGKRCAVVSGQWDDFYYPSELTTSSEIDLDHVVPLKHAYDHGGKDWPKSEKSLFANDPENLVITYKKYNRQKGDSDITKWLPINREYACRYVKRWFAIKEKYKLKIYDSELVSLKQLSCL